MPFERFSSAVVDDRGILSVIILVLGRSQLMQAYIFDMISLKETSEILLWINSTLSLFLHSIFKMIRTKLICVFSCFTCV